MLGTCWTLFCLRTFASALPSAWILQDELTFRFHQAFPEHPVWDDFPSPCLLFSTSVPCFFFQSVSTTYLFYYVWKVKALVAQSCLTLYEPMDCSPPGFPVHRVLQARVLEWVAMLSSRGSSWPRDGTHISYASCVGRQVLLPLMPAGKPHLWLWWASNFDQYGLTKHSWSYSIGDYKYGVSVQSTLNF